VNRFLVVYLSIGSGHSSAANAIKSGIRLVGDNYKVFCEDLFTPAIRDSVLPEFLSLSSTVFAPRLYDAAWQSGSMMPGYEFLQSMPLLKNRMMELLENRKPDLVICTHSLPCSILVNLKNERDEIPPIAAVSTDFMIHPYWPVTGVDGYVVGSTKAYERLIELGAPKNKIKLFGIPVDPAAEILSHQRKERLDGNEPALPLQVLVLAGGKRLAPYVATWPRTLSLLVDSISMEEKLVHWNVVCGRPSTFSKILKETIRDRQDISMFDYVKDFLTLLSRMDFVITKPGGLILAEAMALGVPAILVNRGSGQEAANSEVLLNHRSGFLIETEQEIFDFLTDAVRYPYIYQDASRSAFALGKPAATRLAVDWFLKGMPEVYEP